MDDVFSKDHLIQVSNEDLKTDSQLQVDILTCPDLVGYNLFFIFSILTVAFITIFAFHHYGIAEKTIYLKQNSEDTLISVPSFNPIPFSGFYRIYFKIVQNKKNIMKESLEIKVETVKKYLNGYNTTLINNFTIYPEIQFNGKSTISSPVTLESSHDTSNFSVNFALSSSFDQNDKSVIIVFESGSTSTVIFAFILKFLFFVISVIICVLIIWSHYYTDIFIWVKNFKISIIVWASFIFYSIFFSYQNNSLLYFIFSFISTATFQIFAKLSIIYYITSTKFNRDNDAICFDKCMTSFPFVFYSISEGIISFMISISAFDYDQLNSELKGMKLEFLLNISFLIYIIFAFVKTKSIIETHEKINLITFYSLSLIYMIEKIMSQYFMAIKNIYFCQQALKNIDYASSSIFVFLLLHYNWPIDDDVEIYYQPELVGEDLDLM